MASLCIEIDKLNRNSWNSLITEFNDASIYQTWPYGVSGGRAVSHIALKSGNEVLACSQVSLKRLGFLNAGIADVKWGPLCIKKSGHFQPELMTKLLEAIKEEYATRRGYLLRIWPHGTGEKAECFAHFLRSEGFKRNAIQLPYRTFKLDLSPPLDELRMNFLQKWRNCLNKAERCQLTVVEGTSDALFAKTIRIAEEMAERKSLSGTVDHYRFYQQIQEGLPEPLKMRTMICEVNSEPVCAAICSGIGDTGIYLLGATTANGLRVNGSYLLQWRMIQWMKEKGLRYYDLGAFNQVSNPSVYHFKQGLAGKKGWEEVFLGEWHGCFSLNGYFPKLLLGCRVSYGKCRNWVKSHK